jgi:hypothetical protein
MAVFLFSRKAMSLAFSWNLSPLFSGNLIATRKYQDIAELAKFSLTPNIKYV